MEQPVNSQDSAIFIHQNYAVKALVSTKKIFNKAWTLFRKRKYFIENIRGAAKGEEFTFTENGYHYHAHLLCISKFLRFQEFRNEWTKCVRKAFEEYDTSFDVNTKDGLLNVVIKKVTSSKKGLKDAIQQVCKYLTKSDSWEKIPEKDLVEIASKKRAWRMFELIGSFRKVKDINKAKNSSKKTGNDSQDNILDIQYLSDGEGSDSDSLSSSSPRIKLKKRRRALDWRKHIEKFGLDSYIERLKGEVKSAQRYRRGYLRFKHLYASLKTMDGENF